jgi:hypothetical protein
MKFPSLMNDSKRMVRLKILFLMLPFALFVVIPLRMIQDGYGNTRLVFKEFKELWKKGSAALVQ